MVGARLKTSSKLTSEEAPAAEGITTTSSGKKLLVDYFITVLIISFLPLAEIPVGKREIGGLTDLGSGSTVCA